MPRTPFAAALVATVLLAGCTPDAKTPPAPASSSAAPAAVVDYATWQGGRSTPVSEPLYPKRGNAGLDVLHYGLDLDWSPTTKVLTGTATLRLRPVEDAAEISLDFTGLTVDSAAVDGVTVPAEVAEEKLTVAAPVTADKPVTLAVTYHGTPKPVPMPSRRGDAEEGLGLRAGKDGTLWTMQEPWGAMTWYPANESPSDEALYDIGVTVPEGWSAVAGGTAGPVEGQTFRYASADPVAAYLVTLAVAKYRKTTAKGPGGLPLTYWTLPKTQDKHLAVLKKSPQALTWLEKKFGPYPFPTAGVVLVDAMSAMETQQMVTMGAGRGKWTKQRAQGLESTLVHEYAHHWFGDSVTPTTWTDLWLNEGWAMYAQYLWEQDVYKFSDQALERFLRDADARLRKKSGPPGKPNPKYFAESNVYLCPATMLKELNDALGDKKFFALATAWVQTQKNTHQDRGSFIAFVNKQTGKDFTKLINTWLDSKSTPE
jgi:aminopeptidase N